MGKPRLIILIRHAQSEGNKNRAIHQMIPDHRVKLTEEGWKQAEEAGRRLRTLLKPDDTLQIYTSPYRRTRETTEGILKTLTAHGDPHDPNTTPSPFSRSKIKVYEEPRLREQDFGNFQPCAAEMERMWQERADYGHFFYRIANGESAADAYDRIAGFNETLWRQFGDKDFPSVCVLVTHGLMTRVFLMKWYHWSVEYFEDLRNINHCEFILMRQNMDNGKYVLEQQLRTWSELRRQKAEEAKMDPQKRNTLSNYLPNGQQMDQESHTVPRRQWGGCVEGCNHQNDRYPRRKAALEREARDTAAKMPESRAIASSNLNNMHDIQPPIEKHETSFSTAPISNSDDGEIDTHSKPGRTQHLSLPYRSPSYLQHGRDGGGTHSGSNTPHEMSDDDEYFSSQRRKLGALAQTLQKPQRKPTQEDIERWASESGMGRGVKADGLGDEPEPDAEGERLDRDGTRKVEGESRALELHKAAYDASQIQEKTCG